MARKEEWELYTHIHTYLNQMKERIKDLRNKYGKLVNITTGLGNPNLRKEFVKERKLSA